MKKSLPITVVTLLAGAVSVYSQGQLSLNNGPGSGGSFGIQIFNSQSLATSPTLVTYGSYSGNELLGNSGDTSSYNTSGGSKVAFTSAALGSGYDVQLLIAAGSQSSLSSLSPVGPVITTWYTGSAATGLGGMYNAAANANFGTVGEAVTVAIAAWNNEGGTITSLAAAQQAGDPWGISNLAADTMGGAPGSPNPLPVALESFSLVAPVAATPEPSTIALGVIGASTLLFRRRK